MKPGNFAPVYACMYPELVEISRSHGYALAAHGSMARDFDLVCIPWTDEPDHPQAVVDSFIKRFYLTAVGEPVYKLHDRLVYTLSVKFGECFLDLSFMPVKESKEIRKLDKYKKNLLWLHSHCTAIGMDKKSDSGELHHNVALFTIDLKHSNDKMRKFIIDRGHNSDCSSLILNKECNCGYSEALK